MAKGNRIPGGVFNYDSDGKPSNTKGKRHPEAIASGLELGGKLSGSNPPLVGQTGSNSNYPSGLAQEDGKANLSTKTMPMLGSGIGAAPGGAGSKNKRAVPGINRYDGTRAKNSISKS